MLLLARPGRSKTEGPCSSTCRYPEGEGGAERGWEQQVWIARGKNYSWFRGRAGRAQPRGCRVGSWAPAIWLAPGHRRSDRLLGTDDLTDLWHDNRGQGSLLGGRYVDRVGRRLRDGVARGRRARGDGVGEIASYRLEGGE